MTTETELREATERKRLRLAVDRVRRYRIDGKPLDDIYGGIADDEYSPTVLEEFDADVIVMDYLAEHPADDDAPLDEGFLTKAFGDDGVVYGEWDITGGLRVEFQSCGSYELIGRDDGLSGWSRIRQLDTRGDIRRLCTALGISLKETT